VASGLVESKRLEIKRASVKGLLTSSETNTKTRIARKTHSSRRVKVARVVTKVAKRVEANAQERARGEEVVEGDLHLIKYFRN
jgi:hypothetical protein